MRRPAFITAAVVLALAVIMAALLLSAPPGTEGAGAPTPSPTVQASLAVAKFVDKQQAATGELLQYSLVVMNDMLVGVDPGTAVTMEDALPPQVEFVEGTLTGQAVYEAASATVRWVGQVPRGGSVEVRLQVRVTLAAEMPTVINTLLVTDAFGRQRDASVETQVVPHHLCLPLVMRMGAR